jgi:proline iminopeptidase
VNGDLYPEIEPYDSGLLDVGDGHSIYWETSGNPLGKPAVVLHGGPGAGSSPWHRRQFDPDRHRIILLDQRGCGASTPHAGDPATDLSSNTTWHLVADLERLRAHLGVDRWLVLGGSWGSALALVYAQTHPERVSELVITGVCALRARETRWYWGGGAAHLFPEAWQRFLAPLPDELLRALPDGLPSGRPEDGIIAAYHDLLNEPDPAIHGPAALAWDSWDVATATLAAEEPPPSLAEDLREIYAAARLCNHYTRHVGWIPEGRLIADAARLADIPGVIVQGRYDVQAPATTAWELAAVWPRAELVLVGLAGHSAREPALGREIRLAVDRFAGRS